MAELPTRPAAPQKTERPQRGSWLALLLMFLLAGAVGVVLFVLSLGQLLPILVMGGLIFLVTAFHYVVWGWWLGKMIEREAREEELES
jgi:hypothetical protein